MTIFTAVNALNALADEAEAASQRAVGTVTPTELRDFAVKLQGGELALEAFPTGCPWQIEVSSGCPEPDFPEDLYHIVECGAPVVVNRYGSWQCEHGHEHVSYDDPARPAYEAEQAFNERQER